MSEFIGFLAACLTTLSFLPQAVKVIKTRDTEAISLIMYSMFTTGIFCWLVYGLMIGNKPVIIANIVTFVLAGIILILKIKDTISAGRRVVVQTLDPATIMTDAPDTSVQQTL